MVQLPRRALHRVEGLVVGGRVCEDDMLGGGQLVEIGLQLGVVSEGPPIHAVCCEARVAVGPDGPQLHVEKLPDLPPVVPEDPDEFFARVVFHWAYPDEPRAPVHEHGRAVVAVHAADEHPCEVNAGADARLRG